MPVTVEANLSVSLAEFRRELSDKHQISQLELLMVHPGKNPLVDRSKTLKELGLCNDSILCMCPHSTHSVTIGLTITGGPFSAASPMDYACRFTHTIQSIKDAIQRQADVPAESIQLYSTTTGGELDSNYKMVWECGPVRPRNSNHSSGGSIQTVDRSVFHHQPSTSHSLDRTTPCTIVKIDNGVCGDKKCVGQL